MATMKAAVFKGPGRIVLEEKPIPQPGPGEALVKVTTATCARNTFASAQNLRSSTAWNFHAI
jgi:NADPH:quinone reductase-like Zn-dependent oxidoreductase